MKLSTKGRYAARAMEELAIRYGEGPIMLRKIACRQNVSVRYLERIMAALVAAGLVRSTRGKHGGFSLTKPPSTITLAQVVQTVEGPITPVACVDDPELCKRSNECVTRDIWGKAKLAMLDVLESVTLADLVEKHKEKAASPKKPVYYI
jgi:Rrf2 family protein